MYNIFFANYDCFITQWYIFKKSFLFLSDVFGFKEQKIDNPYVFIQMAMAILTKISGKLQMDIMSTWNVLHK